jgi:hypothetical protein
MNKIFPVLLLLLFLCACTQNPGQVDKISEEGIEVIINHIKPYKIQGTKTTFSLEERFTIDAEREDLVQIGFSDIHGFDLDSEGNIFCLDQRSKTDVLFKFDNQGQFLKSFARRGQGPGEIQTSFALRISAGDVLSVTDILKKILLFRTDGSLKKEIPIDTKFVIVNPLDNGNYCIFWKGGADEENRFFQEKLSLFNSQFEEIKLLDVLKIQKASEGVSGIDPVLFWQISGDRIFVGNEQRGYEILVYDFRGNMIKKIRKEYDPVEVPEELKREILSRIPDESSLKANIVFPDHFAPFRSFFTDDEGRLFVVTHELSRNQIDSVCDIFDSEGAFVGRINLPLIRDMAPFAAPAIIKKRKLYCLQEKDTGYRMLKTYAVQWE